MRPKRIRVLLVVLLSVGVLFVAWLFSPYRLVMVVGGSMDPTLQSGSLLLFDRHFYSNHSPSKGDIIVFRLNEVTYIKRILAVNGETVRLWEYAGPSPAYRDLVDPSMVPLAMNPQSGRGSIVRVRVPRGQVFVIGDSPTNSIDSRNFGPISISDIIGRVMNVPRKGPNVYLRHLQRRRSGLHRSRASADSEDN